MSLANGDLTTLSNIKLWLPNLTQTTQYDVLLQSLISRVSSQIRSWLSRPYLLSRTYTRTLDGSGTARLSLPDWPLTAVSYVQAGPVVIPPMPLQKGGAALTIGFPALFGYRIGGLWDGGLPGRIGQIELLGGKFWERHQNVLVTYTAGYLVASEAQIVPANPGPYVVTVAQPMGICAADDGVSYAAGGSLTAVTGTPGVGQYAPPIDQAPGVYTFSAADAGASVLVSYSFVPYDLQSACEQAVTQQYQQIQMFYGLGTIGMLGSMKVGDTELRLAQALGALGSGAPIAFNAAITSALWPYKTIMPVQR